MVGVGGYVCPPAYMCAAKERIPIIIHEANAAPGWANKLGGRFAEFVGVAFPNTPFRGAELVGMPMSDEIANLDRKTQRSEAMRRLGLDESLPTVIVTGGSLGALTLNKAVEANIDALADWGFRCCTLRVRAKLSWMSRVIRAPRRIITRWSFAPACRMCTPLLIFWWCVRVRRP